MKCTVRESVAPALICTGEVTVALSLGAQMVTDGLTVLSVQEAVAACKIAALPNNKNRRKRKRRIAVKGSVLRKVGLQSCLQPAAAALLRSKIRPWCC